MLSYKFDTTYCSIVVELFALYILIVRAISVSLLRITSGLLTTQTLYNDSDSTPLLTTSLLVTSISGIAGHDYSTR